MHKLIYLTSLTFILKEQDGVKMKKNLILLLFDLKKNQIISSEFQVELKESLSFQGHEFFKN
jgi:hypothetical protein